MEEKEKRERARAIAKATARDGLGSDDLLIFYDIGIVIVIRW